MSEDILHIELGAINDLKINAKDIIIYLSYTHTIDYIVVIF